MSVVPRTLGNYELGELLGRGSNGAVFAAQHRFLGHQAAVKVLHGLLALDPAAAARFFVEAKAIAAICHRSVVRLVDFGRTEEGDLYLVMERLGGRSLRAVLDEGAFASREALAIGAGIADGLAAAHAAAVVHRDLKPANIFVCADRIVLVDFGLAKLADAATLTSPGALLGSAAYLSPEQAEDPSQAGPPSDIYALGVVLFEMVTGRRPFAYRDPARLILAHRHESPPLPSALAPVAPAVERLILQCLHKSPSARPTAAALAASLRSGDGAAVCRPRGYRRRVGLIAACALSASVWLAFAVQRHDPNLARPVISSPRAPGEDSLRSVRQASAGIRSLPAELPMPAHVVDDQRHDIAPLPLGKPRERGTLRTLRHPPAALVPPVDQLD